MKEWRNSYDYIPKLVQRTAVIRCLTRVTAETAEKKTPAAFACPKIPEVSWWGDIGHETIIRYVDRKHGGNWKPYIAKWETHLERMMVLYDQRKGASIPRDRVDMARGEIQREGAVKGDKIILGHEDLGFYIANLVQRTAVHRCLSNAAAKSEKTKPVPVAKVALAEGMLPITRDLNGIIVETATGPFTIQRLADAASAVPPRLFGKPRKCPPYCVQPHEAAPGVATVGELEVLRFLDERRGIVVDTRITGLYLLGTIPGAVNIARKGIVSRLGELGCARKGNAWDCAAAKPALLFCDSSLGSEAPKAIRDIVAAGFPANRLFYYRGGLQSWAILGLTMKKPR